MFNSYFCINKRVKRCFVLGSQKYEKISLFLKKERFYNGPGTEIILRGPGCDHFTIFITQSQSLIKSTDYPFLLHF